MFIYDIDAKNKSYTVTAYHSLDLSKSNQCSVCKCSNIEYHYGPLSATVMFSQKKWPDILMTSCPCWRSVAISGRVLEDMRQASIHGFDYQPLKLESVPAGKMPSSQYWLIIPLGKAVFQYQVQKDMKEKWSCPQCGRFFPSDLARNENVCVKSHIHTLSLDSDFYSAHTDDGDCYMYCSERVIDLAREKKWTNCHFSLAAKRWLGEIVIRHERPNWREILERDIARREAIARGEVVPEEPKLVEQKPKKRKKPIQSNHPFDTLSTFDGTAWQGSTTWVCGFGLCEFVVYPDEDVEAVEDDEGEVWPTRNQRKLFDFFTQQDAEIAKQLQPLLVDFLRNEGISFPDGTMAFSKLAEWLEIGDFEIRNAKRGGGGIVRLAYLLKSNQESIVFHVRCVPSKKTYKIQGEN